MSILLYVSIFGVSIGSYILILTGYSYLNFPANELYGIFEAYIKQRNSLHGLFIIFGLTTIVDFFLSRLRYFSRMG
jgi:hypothetical protein